MRLAYVAASRSDGFLQKALSDAGHLVEARDADGLEAAGFDAVILDLPRLTPALARAAAERSGGAAVIAIVSGDERSGADLLRAGADACLRRPVSVLELLARLDALTQGATPRAAPTTAQRDRLSLDPAARTVAFQGRVVALTPLEFRVFEALAARPGRVMSAAEIVALAWGEAGDADPAIASTYVSRLRAKLERPFGLELIRAVRGHGYRFDAP